MLATEKNHYSIFFKVVAALACALALGVFVYRSYLGLSLFAFGDEIDKLVAAQMIHSGMHLYKEIFSHHGPLLYMFSHGYVSWISATDFTLVRWIVSFIAIVVAFSVAMSPVLTNITSRLIAMALFLTMLSSVWWVQGMHMLLYHGIGGFFLVIVIAQLFLPALFNKKISPLNLKISGAASAASIACAYTFVLPVFLLLAGVFIRIASNPARKSALFYLNYFFGGFTAVASLVAIWLGLYGDLKGYLVYHIYFNQAIYIKFLTFSVFDAINSLIISTDPKKIIGTLATIALAVSITRLFMKIKITLSSLLSTGLLIVAVLMMNPRGAAIFQNGGYVVACFGIFALVFVSAIATVTSPPATIKATANKYRYQTACWIIFCLVAALSVELASRRAVSSPTETLREDFRNAFYPMKPLETEKYNLIRKVVGKNEQFQALILNPEEYIYANRLPATGNFYYLPWQAFYNKNAVSGYKLDICQQLEDKKPPLIVFDNIKIWGVLSVDEYEPCLIDFLKKNYIQHPSLKTIYLRPDRMAKLSVNELK